MPSSSQKGIGFDLSGILRRRSLIPVVLIPKHVADRHGAKHGPHPDKKLPLWLQLQQSQEAFPYGIPLAAISLMRALTELVLPITMALLMEMYATSLIG